MTAVTTPLAYPLDQRSSVAIGRWLPILAFLLMLVAAANGQAAYQLASPDKRIQIAVEPPAAGSTEPPRWSATFRGKPILSDCRLGLEIAEAGDLLAGARVVRTRERSVNQ